MNVGVWFGGQYLEEGEYTLNGGLGNKVLLEIKVKNGILYTRAEWKDMDTLPTSYFKMHNKNNKL